MFWLSWLSDHICQIKCSPHIRGRRGEFAVHHLRAHVLEGPTHGHLDLAILRVFQGFGEAEIDDPEVVVVVGVGEHDVERLEVQVEDPLAVDELDSPEKERLKKNMVEKWIGLPWRV